MDRHERFQRFKLKQKKVLDALVAAISVATVVLLSVISLLKPDAGFSKKENRELAQLPGISLQKLQSGEFMDGAEDYVSDQFVFRDFWIGLKVRADLILGVREFDGIYLGDDKYLMKMLEESDEKSVEESLKAINAFAAENKGININVMLVPNAAYIMQEYLPIGAPTRDQSADLKWVREHLSEDVNCIDVVRTLKQNADKEIYYKTDNHWTSKGASLGFEAAAASLGIDDPVTTYDIYTVSTDFSGGLASVSGYHGAEDSIEVYAPKNLETQYLVTTSDNEEMVATIYDQSALDKNNQYDVFLGGDHAMVDVATANDVDDRLLIVKDSYANCFVQFLLPYYNEIVLIDPLYYEEDIQTLVDEKGITDVLFLYNMDTFMTDSAIKGVLSD